MKKIIFLVSFFLIPFVSFSQLSENFNDGSFYGADRPVEWTGDTNKFTVNDDFQLQLNASNADTLAQLTTALDFSRNMQWEWWMKMDYSPSETDYVNVFLCCDEDSLTGDPNGLFVRIGSADKNVCLMRAEKEHANDTLIKGAENRLSNSTVALRLKAVLDNEGNFSLYSKLDDESEYVLEGSCNISETYESIVFGIACYFSPGHSNGFYFDNFLVEELDPEPIPTPNSSLVEDFGDGLFYGIDRSVEWTGDTSKFTVNGDFQLQLDAPGDGSPAQLKTALDFSQNRQWEWWMKMDFSPTADNYVKVFLCSDTNSLIGDLNGLFVRIGHTDKNVCLMQAQKGKNNKTLIKGAVKRLDKPMVALRLKAVLDNDGNFNLYSKLDDENEYILEGSCNISETYESAVFGIVCYFIPSRNDDFYFDDFLAGEPEDEPEPEPEPEPESNPTPNSSLVEDFSDELFYGDNRSVEWTGDTSKFTVNGNFQLQLDAPGDGSPAQLKTALDFSPNRQWEWWMKMNLNPTAANYANVFLCSDEDSLTGKSNGLFVRIGYTGKNVCLMQAQKGKNNKTLIKGAENRLNNSMVALRLKAVLDNDGNFNLYSKLDGENEYVFEGSCNISETYESSVFGIVCYFSSTHGKDFYFDDFWVGEPEDEPAPNPEPKPNLTPNSSLVEDFSDGLFQGKNRSVEWTGDISKFAVNNALQLQLNASGDGSPAQLKTALDFSPNRQWEWWMKMDFSPTAANYAKVFLCCDENNLTGKPNGLFVRIGYTGKNICLMQAQKEKNNKTLIKGAEKRLDKKTVALRLKAVLDSEGNFNLYSKLDDENEYVLEGSCNISETYESSIFGVVCYFSSTRGKDFYFDDFWVGEPEDEPAPNPEPKPNLTPNSSLVEDFSDGLFQGKNRSVEWTGDISKFAVNNALQLQLNAPGDGSPAQLKTALDFSPNRQWEWWMKMDFSPTAANYAKVFLCCDENNLTGKPNGLFVRIGYTNKNICLMQAQKEKNNKTLIKGAEKRLDKKTVALRLKAVLDNDGNFNLYSKLDDENEYVLEGSCNISETYESSIFGVVCYFSSTRGKDFYFDDFLVREPESDNSAPNPEPETDPEPGDIVINEILYDPPAGCAEYVEIYNNSDKIFDLRFLSFTTRKPSDGSLNTSYPLSGSETLFHPGDYLVITKSRDLVCPFFNCRPGSLFAELSIMPALANASGCAVIRDNKTGAVIDEFAYNAGMHTIGSGNKKGISLERSDFNRPANSADNWYSASAESGFGTPGYQNSQKTDQTGIEKISIVYPQFSADNYSIRYQLDKSGYHCRALIYDVTGKTVNTIADTELSGTEGRLLWNGKGSSGQPLVAGIYIVYIEVYNMDGDVQKFRKPVVVK